MVLGLAARMANENPVSILAADARNDGLMPAKPLPTRPPPIGFAVAVAPVYSLRLQHPNRFPVVIGKRKDVAILAVNGQRHVELPLVALWPQYVGSARRCPPLRSDNSPANGKHPSVESEHARNRADDPSEHGHQLVRLIPVAYVFR